GAIAPLAGRVSLAPADAFVGWLPQEHERVEGETIGQYVARRTGCAEASARLDAAAELLAATDAPAGVDAGEEYSSALERWLASGAAGLDERLPAVLADLGLDGSLTADSLMTGLSGGQAARVGLAALICSRFDIVLLDEPTNDLGLDGLDRLEAFVTGLR